MSSNKSAPCYKVILIGNCKVGKTSFLNYVIGRNIAHKNITPTIGIEYAPFTLPINGQDIRVNIWDTSGAEQYKSLTRSYYRKCQGAIIIFDITDRKSFTDLGIWMDELKNEIKDKLAKILIANKMDLVESGQKQRKVSQKQIVDFCLENQMAFKQTSALTGYNLKESFTAFVQEIHEDKNRKGQNHMRSESSELLKYNSLSLDSKTKNSTEQEGPACFKCC